MVEDKPSEQGGGRALLKRVVGRHGTVFAVGLFLIVAGLLTCHPLAHQDGGATDPDGY